MGQGPDATPLETSTLQTLAEEWAQESMEKHHPIKADMKRPIRWREGPSVTEKTRDRSIMESRFATPSRIVYQQHLKTYANGAI